MVNSNKIRSLFSAALAFGLGLTAAQADVRQGMVSYWPLDSATDTTPDLVYTNNLTLNNLTSAALVTGHRGLAMSFNGSNQSLSVGSAENNIDSGLPVYAAKNYTVAFWVNGLPGQVQRVIYGQSSVAPSSRPSAALMLINTPPDGSGKISVVVRDTASVVQLNNITSTNVALDGTWHHVAWVDNNGQASLYIDGNLDPAVFNYTPSSLLMNYTSLGGLGTNNCFAGALDEVSQWERGLSQSEIQSVMGTGIQTPIPAFGPGISYAPTNISTAIGTKAIFTVLPNGTRPLNFQWSLNSAAIPGATTPTYTAVNVTLGNSGNQYQVTVANSVSNISATATLTVTNDPAPNVASGLYYYWPMDVINSTNAVNGTNTPDVHLGADLTLKNMTSNDITSGIFSNALMFNINETTGYGSRSKGNPIYSTNGYTIAFWVNGFPGQAAEVLSEGSTNTTTPLFMFGLPVSTSSAGYFDAFIRDDNNVYRLNHVTSTNIVFDNTWHHVVWVDENGAARVYIDGVIDAADFSYTPGSMTLNTTGVGAILRATVSSYLLGNIDDLAVWTRALTYTEINQIKTSGVSTFVTPSAPIITTQPAGFTGVIGADYSLSVQALSALPLSYQWFKNSNSIASATNATLNLFFLQATDAGSYYVVVSNTVGAVQSLAAVVTTQPVVIPNLPGITNSLIAYWPMDVFTNNVTPDVFGGNDMTGVNMVASNSVPGVHGNAFAFNGTSQYLKRVYTNTPSVGLPITTNTAYTIAMWVKGPANAINREFFSEANTTTTTPLFQIGEPTTAGIDGVNLFIRNSANGTELNNKFSSTTFFDSAWHHFAMTDNNGTVVIYIDGIAQSVSFSYTKASLVANDTIIGAILRTSAASFFNGQVDDVALWSRILSPTEVQYVMANSPIAPALNVTKITTGSGAVQLGISTPHADWQHVVQATTNLTPPAWVTLSGLTFTQPSTYALATAFAPGAASSTFYRVYGVIPTPYFSDSLETGAPGWTHSGTNDNWVLGSPSIGPKRAHSGVNCWATSLSSNYPLSSAMHLRTPSINLTTASNAWLIFYEFRDVQGYISSAAVDSTVVNVYDATNPNGSPIAQLAVDVGTQTSWTKRVIPLGPAMLGKQVIVEFLFNSGATNPGSHAGWFIDDVTVAALPF